MIFKISKTSSIVFFLDLVPDTEVAETNTSFLTLFGFNIVLGKIAFFATIVVDHLIGVLCLSLTSRVQVDHIDSCS